MYIHQKRYTGLGTPIEVYIGLALGLGNERVTNVLWFTQNTLICIILNIFIYAYYFVSFWIKYTLVNGPLAGF